MVDVHNGRYALFVSLVGLENDSERVDMLVSMHAKAPSSLAKRGFKLG